MRPHLTLTKNADQCISEIRHYYDSRFNLAYRPTIDTLNMLDRMARHLIQDVTKFLSQKDPRNHIHQQLSTRLQQLQDSLEHLRQMYLVIPVD